MNIIIPEKHDLMACANVYISAYRDEPWEETYNADEVMRYIAAYLDSDSLCCYALAVDAEIVGFALGIIVPSIGGSYLRIEDFCIAQQHQRRGMGKALMRLLMDKARERGCTDVLLGTQRNYPAHSFYLQNGFVEVDSVLLYKGI